MCKQSFADFYGDLPPERTVIAVGEGVEFPNFNVNVGGNIVKTTSTSFRLVAIGFYLVQFQVCGATTPCQLCISLNGIQQVNTVVGRDASTSQIVGMNIIQIIYANTDLSIVNPSGNTVITLDPFAGGTKAVSSHLIIMKIA